MVQHQIFLKIISRNCNQCCFLVPVKKNRNYSYQKIDYEYNRPRQSEPSLPTFIKSYLPEEAFENCIVQVAQYNQGRHSNQSHVPWHWLFFCPALKVSTYFGRHVTKTLKSQNWHWLILPPIGANEYNKGKPVLSASNPQIHYHFLNLFLTVFCWRNIIQI